MAEEPQPGDVLGPYRIEELLGRGATGTVYRAVRASDRETVALKVLRAELALDPEYSRRFLREARAAREVDHRHVVRVLDAGTAEGRHFVAMAYVKGTSLAQRLASEGPRPLPEVLRLAAEIGAALDALHARGVVHRDVKPSNILRGEEGAAVLTDFGIAKGRAYTVLTRPGQILGTVDFLAPEVIRGDGATAASDVYGLGCVLFACLAGTPPFPSSSPLEVMVGHLGLDPPDPGAGRDDVSAAVSDAVLRALAKDASARPATGKAYALALWRSATGSG